MKSSVKKYLNEARGDVHNSFNHADGQFPEPAFPRDAFSSFGGNGYRNAAGGSVAVPTSQPYLINITSTSGAAVDNFDVLGSNEYLYGSTGTWVNGSLVIGSITISSGMPNITYREMLSQFLSNPFTVGLTYYASATANQVQQTIQVVAKDANGNEAKRPIVPVIDPYQFQSGVLALKDSYNIDGFTKLTIKSVLANATINLFIYPADNINLARGLNGNPVSKEFSDPGIQKAQKVTLTP